MEPKRCRRQRHDGSGIIKDSYEEHEYFYTGSNLEILAFIQYAFNHSLPLKLRLRKLISYFNDHLQLPLSEKQIEEKLKVFWMHGSSSSSQPSGWFEICAQGLSVLPCLPQEKKDRVHRRAQKLEAVLAHEHDLRGSRRTLQSSGASCADAENQTKGVGSLAGAKGRRNRKRMKRRDPWSLTRKKKKRMISTPVRPLGSTPPTMTSTKREEIRDSQEPASTVEGSFDGTLLPRHTCSAPEMNDSPQAHRKDNTKAEAVPRPAQHTPLSQVSDSSDQQSVIARLRLDLEAQRIEKVDELQQWRDLYLKEQRRRRKLMREVQLLQTKLTLARTGKAIASQDEVHLRDEIESLRASVNTSVFVKRFKAPFPRDFQEKITGKVWDDFNKITEILSKVPLQSNAAFNIDVTKINGSSELLKLLERAFGRVGESVIDSPVAELLCHRGLTEVLLSLVGAAICSWVLESNAAGLFQENDLIYPKLRGLLTAQDSKLADSLEFAAHMEFVDDRSICELVVSRRARVLSRRLVACVLPLVEAHQGSSEHYDAIAREWSRQEDGLTSIFKLALEAKVRLLLTPDLYRCVFPVPGTKVNDKIMRVGLDHGPFYSGPGQNAATGITILPALLRYAAAHESFTYDRFLPNARLTKKIKPDVWMRARVLV